jgi:uncharacterized YigZ family protein
MKLFRTIAKPAEGIYKEKGSKFLAYAYPVATDEEVKSRLEEMKHLHPKARHVCYAFVLGAEKDHYRASDANEPPNTAGPPILGQIRSYDLTNVLIIVVRYFGGTKLGVGGLIQAYKEAASDALTNSLITEDFEKENFIIEIPYSNYNKLLNFLLGKNIVVLHKEFGETCTLKLGIAKELAAVLKEELQKFDNLKVLN